MALTRLGLNQAINLATNTTGNLNLASQVTGTLATGNGGTGATSFTAGITMADQYRLSSDISNTSADITSNLERVDDATFSPIGTGMTVSSGIFTFPSTGIYMITSIVFFDNVASDADAHLVTNVSSDGGSSFDQIMMNSGGNSSSSRMKFTTSMQSFVDVTNTSNFKVKFTTEDLSNCTVNGSSSKNQTAFTFIRLGDT